MTEGGSQAAEHGVIPRPLVVDLDNTLVRTDTLVESLFTLMTRRPLEFLRAIAALRLGRAGFKRFVAGRITLDCTTLPYDQEIIAFIRERREAGGQVFLVTAADQSIADGVAEHLGLFDGVIGSDGAHNLKGANKAAALIERLGGDFDYLGDSTADLDVWASSREVYVAGHSVAVTRELRNRNIVPARRFLAPRMTRRDWIKALRLHQWAKNLLLFVPLFLGQEFHDWRAVARVIGGFFAFGLVASATYLFNDMNDLAADRGHFGKRYRALASGKLSLPLGFVLAFVMLVGGMAAAFALRVEFGLVLLCYLALTLSYSLWLKAQPLLDVLVIGGLFTIRIYAGLALTAESSSLWLSSFAMILFASLALAKRHAELIRAAADARDVVGRGYRVTDAPLTVSLGVAMAAISAVVMLLYLHFDADRTHLYHNTASLHLIPLVLASWLMRIWVRAHRGELHDDPVIFALKDKVSILHALLVANFWMLAII